MTQAAPYAVWFGRVQTPSLWSPQASSLQMFSASCTLKVLTICRRCMVGRMQCADVQGKSMAHKAWDALQNANLVAHVLLPPTTGEGADSIMSPPQLLVLLRDWSLDLEVSLAC